MATDPLSLIEGTLASDVPEYEILRIQNEDRTGDHEYRVNVLQEFGSPTDLLTPEKIRDLWMEYRQHDMLFTDETRGKLKAFLPLLWNPRAVWLEIFHMGEDKPVGVVYITRVRPGFDADVHFAVWDGVAAGREPIFNKILEWIFNRYQLHRISGETPVSSKGALRLAKRLGFEVEGEKKEAVPRNGHWIPLVLLGMTVTSFNGEDDG